MPLGTACRTRNRLVEREPTPLADAASVALTIDHDRVHLDVVHGRLYVTVGDASERLVHSLDSKREGLVNQFTRSALCIGPNKNSPEVAARQRRVELGSTVDCNEKLCCFMRIDSESFNSQNPHERRYDFEARRDYRGAIVGCDCGRFLEFYESEWLKAE